MWSIIKKYGQAEKFRLFLLDFSRNIYYDIK